MTHWSSWQCLDLLLALRYPASLQSLVQRKRNAPGESNGELAANVYGWISVAKKDANLKRLVSQPEFR